MRRRTLLATTLAVTTLALMSGIAVAQSPADIDAVKAANAAFYTTLATRDSKAMEGLWANKPYVIDIGPVSKTITVGFEEAVAKYWANAFTNVFSELNVSMTPTQVQTDGKMAWVVGTENAKLKTKAGEPREFTAFVTNIFEKDGNRWLLVSQQAGIVPK